MGRLATIFALSLFLSLGACEPQGDDPPEQVAPCADLAGAGGDILCYSTDGASEHRLVEASDANPYGADPLVIAAYAQAADSFVIAAGMNYVDDPDVAAFATSVTLELPTAAAGTFTLGGEDLRRVGYFDGADDYEASSARVTITELTDSRVQGTFTAWVCPVGNVCRLGMELTGAFDVTREPDGWSRPFP